ncbi:MAG: (Fe-S)-binding protein, partial [Anaerolineae bacterium]|nr:(Fe-S)-binding protein [Anaerolineae bacterium]
QLRRLARVNIVLFERLGPLDAIVTDCAACSHTLKEYAALLANEPAFAARAAAFSTLVRDIYEWYDAILPATLGRNATPPLRVTIHDACHLANAQGIRAPQRRLLARIRGIEVVEMEAPSACCGSAGIYNITHPAMADRRLARKLDDIRSTGAAVVVTNGPGCLLQLRAAVRARRLPFQVWHISQLLAQCQPMDASDVLSADGCGGTEVRG